MSFRANPPAAEAAIADLGEQWLPGDYLAFLRTANGGEGFVGELYAVLFPAEELFSANIEYQAEEFAPEVFVIGSNGGGELYCFDPAKHCGAVYQVPAIRIEYVSLWKVAESFTDFVNGVHGNRSSPLIALL